MTRTNSTHSLGWLALTAALSFALPSFAQDASADAATAGPSSDVEVGADATSGESGAPADDDSAGDDTASASGDSTAPDGATPDAAGDEPPAADAPAADAPAGTGDDALLEPSGEQEDESFFDLDVTQSDEPSLLERQIVAIVASGVAVVALAAGVGLGVFAYVQYQCLADVIACNENLEDPITGTELFDARANVEQLALLADMAYLFAAASALVAVTGFIRGFFFTGKSDDAEPTKVEGGSTTSRREERPWRVPAVATLQESNRSRRGSSLFVEVE